MSSEKVKTRKVVKRRLKIKRVLFLVCFIVLAVFAVKALLKVDVGTVSVSGNHYVKDSDVIKNAGFNNDVKYFKFSSNKVCKKVMENPFIKTCDIKRKLDFQVEIVVEENTPLFYYNNDSAIVLSNGGRVTGNVISGIPTLINYVPEDVMSEFISRLISVKSDILYSIGEIEYSPSATENGTYIDKERFVLSMNDGNTVYINNRRMDNLNYYEKIYASLGDKKGVFNFDCDYDSILFKEYGEQ